jgi:hypothetical protein
VVAQGRTYSLQFVYEGNAGRREALDPLHVPDPNVPALAAVSRRLGLSGPPLTRKRSTGEQQKDFLPDDLLVIQRLTDDTSGRHCCGPPAAAMTLARPT